MGIIKNFTYVHIRNSGNSLTRSRTLRFHFLYNKTGVMYKNFILHITPVL